MNPSSVDIIKKAEQDYLEMQKRQALEQCPREAKLFDIWSAKEVLSKELQELQVKKMRAKVSGTAL